MLLIDLFVFLNVVFITAGARKFTSGMITAMAGMDGQKVELGWLMEFTVIIFMPVVMMVWNMIFMPR